MRINPITARINYHNCNIPKNNTSIQKFEYAEWFSGIQMCNYISFMGKTNSLNAATSDSTFRKLLKYDIPDMYTGKLMISQDLVESFVKKGLFNKNIKKIVTALLPYKDRLHAGEQNVLTILEKDAKTNPDLTLSEAIRKHYAEKREELRNLQEPIFNKLEELAKGLPENRLRDFQELMEESKAILSHKSIVQRFSKTDFRYKLKRIQDYIKISGTDEENIAIDRLIEMAERLHHTPKNNGKNIKKFVDDVQKKQEKQINNMIKYYKRTPLVYNQDLRDILDTARNQILGIPSYVQFSRKIFIYKLEKIVQNIDNKKLARDIQSTAQQLPMSWQEDSAFFVKCSKSTSEKIGISLLRSAVGTIEHLKPKSKKGEDKYANYGLASSITNTLRGCMNMGDYLRLHPEAYENCQKYVDRLIELSNNKVFKRIGLPKSYITDFIRTMRQLSPEEKPMQLNYSALL